MESSTIKQSSSRSPPYSFSFSSLALITIIPVALLLFLSPWLFHHYHPPPPPPPPTVQQPPHPFIKNTCRNTLYPSLCFHTLSSIPINHHNNNRTNLRQVLQFAINKTINRATKSRSRMAGLTVKIQETSWVNSCIDLLDQTIYELQESIKPLNPDTNSHNDLISPPYAIIKNLLSAAMTNENTCIEGFNDITHTHTQTTRLARYFQKSLTPIMRMISNCLAIVSYIETAGRPTATTLLLSPGPVVGFRDHVPSWMTAADRRLMQTPPPPTVVVAMDGSGNFTTINAAVAMAPNRTTGRYVVQIKAGVYYENVVIPRQKINIMLVGEGMNSTIITGSRNFVDGYTTFT